ncbi:MAG: UDP-N-acetylmuramoyl-L-alanyl-D-glutamate--2,6-diaminopimelate ligase [Pseudomonadota bacterium]
MKLSALAAATVSPDPEITGLTADSRQVRDGFLFAALPGVKADGAAFIPQAEKRGASAVLARPGAQTALPIIEDDNPRKRLAEMAARFYPQQPEMIVGITGTNGKTSTAHFAEQIWSRAGRAAGRLGTLGAVGSGYERKLVHTTPEPVLLHETLQAMAGAGVTHLAMEVSSHGLAQYRADGVRFQIAAFSNITQDHLDYHASFEDYFAAKLRLFDELVANDGAVVVNADGEGAARVADSARRRGLTIVATGAAGADIKLLSCEALPDGLSLAFEIEGGKFTARPRLIGAFQAENALLAAGIALASGVAPKKIVEAIGLLEGAPGRMQHIGGPAGAGVIIDYAHTPDAIATALAAIRPHASARVIAIIGAGGDRDRSKRPLMGAAAIQNADMVIVTDDNPRSEDASAIRAEVMAGSPGASEIGDRADAIAAGVAMLQEGDVLMVLGKGHETGQQVGDETLPFDDVEVASAAVKARNREISQ